MKYLFTLSFLFAFAFQSCYSQDTNKTSRTRLPISKERPDSLTNNFPPTIGFINDFLRLFSYHEIKALDSLVSVFEKETSIEICVATVDSAMVKDNDFNDYTLAMFNTWGIGKKDKNNGILIAISPDLRRMRIQNGYGIENILSDADTKYIIDNSFIPKFKEGKYFEGTRDGIIVIIKKLRQNSLK